MLVIQLEKVEASSSTLLTILFIRVELPLSKHHLLFLVLHQNRVVLLLNVIVLHIKDLANLKLIFVVVVAIVDLPTGFAFGEAQNEFV